jgi:DNA-binding SARP family transcriptional activator
MQVRLLGPVDVVVDGESRPVHGLRRTTVLAALALRHGEVVSVDGLVEMVWGSVTPSTPRNTLQSHVSYLRGVLGSKTAIRTKPPGYLLDLDGGTDVQQAEQLLRCARQAADPAEGVPQLRTALGLWRGRPLADLADVDWMDKEAAHLDRLHAEVVHALAEARLGAGEHRALIPELEQLAAERPLDEQLHAQLMLAMYRSGRQADALAVCQRMRFALAEELGVPVARIPPDLPAQAALYRSVLAGQRVLVVLANARDAEQVRPLLPGSPGCMVIVTSRDRLSGLVATEGAHPLTLDLLTAADARDLLSRRLGPGRVTREPTAVDAIIAGCARLPLPLALTVAAARAVPAGRHRRRAGRSLARAGSLPVRRRGHRRQVGLLVVVPGPQPGCGAVVPAARPASRPGLLSGGSGQSGRHGASRGQEPPGRAHPRASGCRACPRPVRGP